VKGVCAVTGDVSERRITNPSDRLNVFLDMLNLFQDSLTEFYGLPIPYSTDTPIGDIVVSVLYWGIGSPTQGQAYFPSYSWVIWDGKVCPSVNGVYKEHITASLLSKHDTVTDDAEVLRKFGHLEESICTVKYIHPDPGSDCSHGNT
jgi:hypothetical protein